MASIKSMSKSELSRRRLKTYVSDPPLPEDDVHMEASLREEEAEHHELDDSVDEGSGDEKDETDEKDGEVHAADDTLEYEPSIASIAGSESEKMDDACDELCENDAVKDGCDPVGDGNSEYDGDDGEDDAMDGDGSEA